MVLINFISTFWYKPHWYIRYMNTTAKKCSTGVNIDHNNLTSTMFST